MAKFAASDALHGMSNRRGNQGLVGDLANCPGRPNRIVYASFVDCRDQEQTAAGQTDACKNTPTETVGSIGFHSMQHRQATPSSCLAYIQRPIIPSRWRLLTTQTLTASNRQPYVCIVLIPSSSCCNGRWGCQVSDSFSHCGQTHSNTQLRCRSFML